MPHSSSQTFLRELDKKLWTAADKLAAQANGIKERGRLARSYKITSTGKLIATIPFQHADLHAKDILGQDQESTASDSSSASLGDLCAFAVKNSKSIAIGGIDFDFGKEPADTFTRDQHPDLRADFVMANPPFNIKEWWDGKLEGDARWNRSEAELASHAQFYKKRGKYGTPPQGKANVAWV